MSANLLEAAKIGRTRAVGLLLRCGDCWVDCCDADGKSALYWAAFHGHRDVAALLIGAQAQLDLQDSQGWTPLHAAASRGHAELVQLLATSSADVNLAEKAGNSPLHLAAECGHISCVRWLLLARANCDLKTQRGRAAIHCASQHGHEPVVRLLLSEAADPNVLSNVGAAPLHIASLCGHASVINVLIESGADLNALNGGCHQSAPLHLAAKLGREDAVELLLRRGCDASATDAAGLSAAALACCFGHVGVFLLLLQYQQPGAGADDCEANNGSLSEQLGLPSRAEKLLQTVVRLLNAAAKNVSQDASLVGEPLATDKAVSLELHSALNDAGFVQAGAAMNCSLADALQELERRRWGRASAAHLVGSFADGWGNSLVCQDGATDADADIDETVLLPGRLFHLRGFCGCGSAATEADIVDYDNGHVEFSGSASNPAKSEVGSILRPAIDIIFAYPCCSYPTVRVLEPGHESQISPSVLESLRQEMARSPCHLVAAAPPGQEGTKLRISSSFLEKKMMRSLTTEQGQVFVLLKHILKQVVPKELGLKSYHAKSLMFYLLDEVPAGDWQPTQLVSLTRRGLHKLLKFLNSRSNSNQCMTHFFLQDAWLYLKKEHKAGGDVASSVTAAIGRLPGLLLEFKKKLRPLGKEGHFRFEPFLILPDPEHQPVLESKPLLYHEVSDVVRSLLMKLSIEECNEDLEAQLTAIRRLPDFAATARESLVALAYLKFDQKQEAISVLRNCLTHRVSRGVPSAGMPTLGVADFVWQHLESTDSAWKFCFEFEEQHPVLSFLPECLLSHFPCQMHYVNWFYLNSLALLRCLCLHLDVADDTVAQGWFKESLSRDDTDLQELLMTLQFCQDKDLLVELIHKHRRVICEHHQLRWKIERRLRHCTRLRQLSMQRTVKTALAELHQRRRSCTGMSSCTICSSYLPGPH